MPQIVRPATLPRAARPVEPPQPEHHHLPNWVRRVHGRARPILADLIGGVDGEARSRMQDLVAAHVAAISGGRFSLAWQYPALIQRCLRLFDEERRRNAEAQRAQRALEARRRRAADALREAAPALPADVVARLNRTVRSAPDEAAVDVVETELQQVVSNARATADRRRVREIDRTRNRIRRTLPATTTQATESWQDVLRRYAESQTSG